MQLFVNEYRLIEAESGQCCFFTFFQPLTYIQIFYKISLYFRSKFDQSDEKIYTRPRVGYCTFDCM